MVFSSTLFIFQFLPVALILYYIVPKKAKNLVLVIVSLFFYSWGEFRYFPIMIATIAVNYYCALGMEWYGHKKGVRKLLLAAALVVSFGFLFVFKYLGFFTENINFFLPDLLPRVNLVLPLGISFYTFQTLSYTIDVYKRKIKPDSNIIDIAAFVALFPALIAGPIVRYTDIAKELKEHRITAAGLDDGMEDFIIGLAKKVIIANNIGALWTEIEYLGFDSISTGLAWLAALGFSLQIYFDFSGYSQMAIGIGKMLGFNFPKNFDNPYSSRSVTEFWRRWHMTLGSWFREYVYFPLGGSRKGNFRTVLNLFIVWALTGLWHGASWNFVLWGLFFFALLTIEKFGIQNTLDKSKVFSRIYIIVILIVGWMLFAITDFGDLLTFLTKMFVPTFITDDAPVGIIYYLRNYAVIIAIGCWFSTKFSSEFYKNKIRTRRVLRNALLVVLFLLSVAYLVDSTYNPFLYFRF